MPSKFDEERTNSTLDFYNNNAKELFEKYESSTFEEVHSHLLRFLPAHGACILDIGSGSGRDAKGLAMLGYKVWAVEPSASMLHLAKTTNSHENITWVEESLPNLKKILEENIQFDFILISAVWSHLSSSDQNLSIKNIKKILKPKGKLAISIRMKSFEDSRYWNDRASNHTIAEGEKINLSLIDHRVFGDKLKRTELSWDFLLFERV